MTKDEPRLRRRAEEMALAIMATLESRTTLTWVELLAELERAIMAGMDEADRRREREREWARSAAEYPPRPRPA